MYTMEQLEAVWQRGEKHPAYTLVSAEDCQAPEACEGILQARGWSPEDGPCRITGPYAWHGSAAVYSGFALTPRATKARIEKEASNG